MVSAFVSLEVALMTVFYKPIKVAQANPIEWLRYE